jgi:transposase InsO family protein
MGIHPYLSAGLAAACTRRQEADLQALALNDVADYIDRFYNQTRRHSHLGGLSPDQFEAAQKPR